MIIYDKKDIPEHLWKYFEPAEIGLEKTPEEYVAKMREVFNEVKRVLKRQGTCWINLGDGYNGSGEDHKAHHKNDLGFQGKYSVACGGQGKRISNLKPKNLIGIPWRVAFALQADGWYLRQDIIWHKPNPMPESVTDRCTKAHEYIFLLSKFQKYYFDNKVIREPTLTQDNSNRKRDITKLNNTPGRTRMAGLKTNNYQFRNKRSVWTITTKPFRGAHFATFPEDLIRPCILAGCPKEGVVLDPFFGAGTTGLVAKKTGRNYIGIELNPEYVKMAEERIGSILL